MIRAAPSSFSGRWPPDPLLRLARVGPSTPKQVGQSEVASVDPTPKQFGAKHQSCPHLAVHVPNEPASAVWAAETGTAIRCCEPKTFPKERRRRDRSPPTRSGTRPLPVSSQTAWHALDSIPTLHTCHPRLVNAHPRPYRERVAQTSCSALAINPRARGTEQLAVPPRSRMCSHARTMRLATTGFQSYGEGGNEAEQASQAARGTSRTVGLSGPSHCASRPQQARSDPSACVGSR